MELINKDTFTNRFDGAISVKLCFLSTNLSPNSKMTIHKRYSDKFLLKKENVEVNDLII